MPTRRITILFFALLLASSISAIANGSVQRTKTAPIATRSACWKIYKLITRTHDEDPAAEAAISKYIQSIKSPAELRAIVVWSIHRGRSHGCDGECPICNRYENVYSEGVYALSKFGNDESVRLLVSLLEVDELSGNSHGMEGLYEAIVRIGKRALPYLEPLKNKNLVAKDVISELNRSK